MATKRKSPTFVIATFPRDNLMNNRMTEAMMGVRHRWEWRRRLLARRPVCFCVRFLKRGSGVLTCLQSTREDQPGKKRMSGLNGEIYVLTHFPNTQAGNISPINASNAFVVVGRPWNLNSIYTKGLPLNSSVECDSTLKGRSIYSTQIPIVDIGLYSSFSRIRS